MSGNGEPKVQPYLAVKGGEAAIAYYEKHLGAELAGKMMAEDGERLLHATLLIQGSPLMLSDEFPDHGGHLAPDPDRAPAVAISVRLPVPDDVDRIFQAITGDGGRPSQEPWDSFWGDRFAQVIDPFGHRWMLTSTLPQTPDTDA